MLLNNYTLEKESAKKSLQTQNDYDMLGHDKWMSASDYNSISPP